MYKLSKEGIITDIMRQPKISIVTITFNSEKTLERTIKSVVEQNYDNLEYIIIDGGSKDGITGLLYHFGDVEALADKMQQIIEHHDMMVDLAGNGHHYALNNFLSEKNTKAIYDLYKGLLK